MEPAPYFSWRRGRKVHFLKLTASAQPKRNYALLIAPLRFTVSTSSDAAENLNVNGLLGSCNEINANTLDGSKNLPPQTPPRVHMASSQYQLETTPTSARKNDFSGHLATMRSPFCRGGQNRQFNFSPSSSFPEDLGAWFSTGTQSQSGSTASSPEADPSRVVSSPAATRASADTLRAADATAPTGPNRKRAILQEQENADDMSASSVSHMPEPEISRPEHISQAGCVSTVTPVDPYKRVHTNDGIPATDLMNIRRSIEWESSTAVSSAQNSPIKAQDTIRDNKVPKGLLRKTPTASDGESQVSASTRKCSSQISGKRFPKPCKRVLRFFIFFGPFVSRFHHKACFLHINNRADYQLKILPHFSSFYQTDLR
jgi:hypothetical protein